MRAKAFFTLVALGAGVALGAPAPAPAPAREPLATVPSVAPLVTAVRNTVVSVQVAQRAPRAEPMDPFDWFFGRPDRRNPGEGPEGGERYRRGLGSGFIIDASGSIVTNNHVVQDATSVRVKLDDGREFDAEVRGRDPLTDVALLKLKGNPGRLPVAVFGDSGALQIGDWVVAIGSPFGLNASVSAGIISAKARDIQLGPYDDFLQTDAAINPGNSGGPLFNVRGEVVGMSTAIVGGGAGIGFAVPSNLIQTLLPQLQEQGRVVRGFLGIQVQDLTPELAKALGAPAEQGAIVADITEGSPASRANVRRDDVVISLNGKPVSSAAALTRQVALLRPGNEASLRLLRQGHPLDVRLKVGTRPDIEKVGAQPPPVEDSAKRLGLVVQDIPPEMREQLGGARRGALITEVTPGTPAANADLREGMVIVEVAGARVEGARDLVAALQRAKPGSTLLLRVRIPGADATLLRAITVP